MKITTNNPEPDFKPFEVTIKIEDMAEAEDLYFIANYAPIVDACQGAGSSRGLEALRNLLRKKTSGFTTGTHCSFPGFDERVKTLKEKI